MVLPADLLRLQNGSDIRGIALEGIPGEEVNLTSDTAYRIGKSFALWLSEKTGKNPSELFVAVGTDSRLSGPALKAAFIEGVSAHGGKILDAGLATTPAMFMATRFGEYNADGSVMLTASHLPFNRNGFKFFTYESGLEKKDITEILEFASEIDSVDKPKIRNITSIPLIETYASHLCAYVREKSGREHPLEGMKILVDAGNGAGGFFAAGVLSVLGADTSGSLFLEPDGNFPNHAPNPEDRKAMEIFCSAVTREKADLGIIFDTDVDRAAVVDRDGQPINRNRLVALLSSIVLEEHPGTVIVTDSVTSEGLREFITARGGRHFRFRRGYRNVINKSIELNAGGSESWLAIETSGHGAFRENYFLDDGAFITTKVLVKFAELTRQGRDLGDLIASLREPAESEEFRLPIHSESFVREGEKVIDRLRVFTETVPGWECESENYEGIRVRCDNSSGSGWFLLRLSLHDPVMPLNVESEIVGGVKLIVSKLKKFFKDFESIESNSLA